MHSLIWQLLQLLVQNARSLSEPGEPNAEYVRGQVNLIMDVTGLGGYDEIYDILTSVITHVTGEVDGMIKINAIVRQANP